MKTLIIKLPRGKNAELLIETAFALAHYRTTTSRKYEAFRDELHDFNEYEPGDFDFPFDWIPSVVNTSPASTNHHEGLAEYEFDAGMFDVVLMRTLMELQKLIPFEMHFENRTTEDERLYKKTFCQPDDGYYKCPQIEDDALYTLYHAEPAVYATVEDIKKWRARQTTAPKIFQLPTINTEVGGGKVKRYAKA